MSGKKPKRIQRRRVKGWRMPEGAVYVGRPSKWGNPFTREHLEKHGLCGCPACVTVFFDRELSASGCEMIRRELRGKDVACWCPVGQHCHGDVLLEIANGWRD